MRKIEAMLCAIAENPPEHGRVAEEGIAAAYVGGMMMPLMSTSGATVEGVRLQAQAIATATGKELSLIRFVRAEVVEVIRPAWD